MAPTTGGMRVLRLCSVFEPPSSALAGRGAGFDPIGGMQEHTGSLTRLLERRGVVQVVLTTRPPTAPWVERIAPRATVVRLGLPVRRPRQCYAVPAAALAPLLGLHADLVHVHLGEDLAILPLAAMAARPRRLPMVVTVHCSLTHTLQICDARTALLRTLGGWLERRGVRRADVTIVYTSRLADRLTHDLGRRDGVRLIRRGVDRAPFALEHAPAFPEIPGRPRVLYLGRLVKQKGIETLIAAAAGVRTPGVQVLLVGDGPERVPAERLAERLGIADRVHVTGFVDHKQVPGVLASADLLVLPSLYEELGTVLVEALQAGIPVVASRVGGIPEVVEHGVTGLLVEPGQPDALAAAIDTVLGDAPLAARLAANARHRAPEYDVDRVGAQVHALYDGLVEEWRTRHRAPAPGAAPTGRPAVSLWPA
jgi:glycogen(starch) synthase